MNLKSAYFVCLLLIANPTFAIPILSADGSLLSGVVANGETYDVRFGDAVLGDIYSTATVGAAGWFDLADAVKQGIVDALSLLSPSAGDINGCTAGATIVGIDVGCIILIPDVLDFGTTPPRFRDTEAAQITAIGLATRTTLSSIVLVGAEADSGFYGNLTFAQFERIDNQVPAPSTLFLLIAAAAAFVRVRAR